MGWISTIRIFFRCRASDGELRSPWLWEPGSTQAESFLTACLLGLEAGIRLARSGGQGGSFLKTGFHPTSLCGAFSSVLTAGRLMHPEPFTTGHGWGLVLSSASGNMQPTQEGAWARECIRASWAPPPASTSASLAQQGYRPFQVYEGRYGLFPCFLGQHAADADLGLATDELGERWECMRTSIKLYPACYQSHAAMNAAVELRAQESLKVGDIGPCLPCPEWRGRQCRSYTSRLMPSASRTTAMPRSSVTLCLMHSHVALRVADSVLKRPRRRPIPIR
ncbi:MAG: MmgE/PrpD family protein [Burkholderiales bacterium]|nr:MmgE/PrpD family protein [Burkholderiales bacterium]